jgi:threonine synthase
LWLLLEILGCCRQRISRVEVIILYPSGRVSNIQEKQLTTLGQNIKALEVDGVFDDCQDMVKKAFLDDSLTSQSNFSKFD